MRSTRRCRPTPILVSDIGIHHNWLIQFCKPRQPDSLIGSMGYGPWVSASPACLGRSSRRLTAPACRCAATARSFMHASVLGTAVEYDIPVVWVVWNNYAYASIRGLQRGYLGAANSPPTSSIPTPGCLTIRISPPWRGPPALRASDRPRRRSRRCRAQGIATGRPYLIDAQISADRNPGGAGVWELPGRPNQPPSAAPAD
jgi:acetolactate synthase-1/2/3 large subunit